MTHKASIVNPLPSSYRAKIEALDPGRQRITSVCGMRWIGGQIENDPRPLSTLAVDSDTFLATFPEYALSPEEIQAWERDRQALIVGRGTAGHFGWKVGDRLTINPSVPPYTPMEFHVVSTAQAFDSGSDPYIQVFVPSKSLTNPSTDMDIFRISSRMGASPLWFRIEGRAGAAAPDILRKNYRVLASNTANCAANARW